MTEQSVKVCLRLDNGDTICGSVGNAVRSARLVGIRQQIEAGELSAEAQRKRLDDIALIYQRLHEPAHAQKRRLEGMQVRKSGLALSLQRKRRLINSSIEYVSRGLAHHEAPSACAGCAAVPCRNLASYAVLRHAEC